MCLRFADAGTSKIEDHPHRGRIGGACLSHPLGGARLSCPMNLNGSSMVAPRTRQAGPAEGEIEGHAFYAC